jgi:hypothetical protein
MHTFFKWGNLKGDEKMSRVWMTTDGVSIGDWIY